MKQFATNLFVAAATLFAIAFGVHALAANTIPQPDLDGANKPPGRICTQYNVLPAGTRIDTSPSFGIDQKSTLPDRPLVTVLVKNVDANSSVTTWRMVCTVSTDANATDYTQTTVQVVDGVATLYAAGTFQFASPGSKSFPVSFNLVDMPDFECTFTAAAGAAAAIDTLTVDVRLCVGEG